MPSPPAAVAHAGATIVIQIQKTSQLRFFELRLYPESPVSNLIFLVLKNPGLNWMCSCDQLRMQVMVNVEDAYVLPRHLQDYQLLRYLVPSLVY